MSALAERALREGRLGVEDRAWVALRLRQGRFSVQALFWLDYVSRPSTRPLGLSRSLHVRLLRAKRLGYREGGDITKWDIDLIEKWFEEQGLNPF